MYKSKSFRDIQREQGLTKITGRSRATVLVGIANQRWNKGALPKGANKTTGGKIGQQKTSR